MRGHIDDEAMSQRLTSLDTTFLELEDADEASHMHIGAVRVFEARAEGPPALDQLQTEIGRRRGLLPRYRFRLTEPQVGPLRRPAPGARAAHSGRRARVDGSRPLWETVLLEGLEGGRWALATKIGPNRRYVSYDGKVFFGLSGDARALPDVDTLRLGIEDSVAGLRGITRHAGRAGGVAAASDQGR